MVESDGHLPCGGFRCPPYDSNAMMAIRISAAVLSLPRTKLTGSSSELRAIATRKVHPNCVSEFEFETRSVGSIKRCCPRDTLLVEIQTQCALAKKVDVADT